MSMQLKWRREVAHGGAIPRGWQMAWYEPRRRVGVYFPVPLHWLFRAMREFAYRVQIAMRAPGLEGAQVFELQRANRQRQILADEFARGYLAGWHECFEACLTAVEEEISRSDDVWELGALLADAPDEGRKN
jgi:hypothetical protein